MNCLSLNFLELKSNVRNYYYNSNILIKDKSEFWIFFSIKARSTTPWLWPTNLFTLHHTFPNLKYLKKIITYSSPTHLFNNFLMWECPLISHMTWILRFYATFLPESPSILKTSSVKYNTQNGMIRSDRYALWLDDNFVCMRNL